MFEEEIPKVDFVYVAEDGTRFVDSLIFQSMAELRNTSLSERRSMMEERYNNWKAAIEAAQNAPQEETPPEEQ